MRRFFLAGLAAAFLAAPALAADDENLNSGFGKDMFAGEEHPAFADPSIHDPNALQAIAPAAGFAAEAPTEKETKPAAAVTEIPAARKETAPGTGGMTSTIIAK